MVEALTAVWAQSEARDSDLLVFLAIANDYNHEHEAAWPTVDRLASMARVSSRQVQYSLRRLVESGELAIDEKAVTLPSGRKANRYRILLPIQTRRVSGAKSAPDKKRRVQSATSTGAISDSAYKEDPLKEHPLSTTTSYVKPTHIPRHHFWCGEIFCVSEEQHFKFTERVRQAGFNPDDLEWQAWYSERDAEWDATDIPQRHPKGAMYWLAGKLSDEIDTMRQNSTHAS